MSLRIAMVIDPWLQPFNGTVVSTRRFVAALEAAGRRVTVLAIGDARGPVAGEPEFAPFSRLSVPGFNRIIDAMRAPLARPDARRLRDVVRTCDIVHVQFPFLLGYAAIGAARRQGVPVICSFHVQPENILVNIGLGGAALRNLLYALFVWAFYNRAAAIVAPTAFAADLLRAHGVTRPITVISNGVPDIFFAVERPRAPGGERPLRLLSVGRLAKEKGHETLLRAVAASAHRADIELTLVGAGPREVELNALAAALGVNVRIGAVGDRELLALYARADLFVHASAVELEGMSVLEAMAAGLAVIVSDSPDSAAARIVIDERARFRAGASDDLARKIDHLLGDPAELDAQGRANRAYAAAFSHRRSVAQLCALYDEVAFASRDAARTRA